MYCNRCGTTLPPQQTVCPSCGQVQPTSAAQSRLAAHLRLLGIFWIIMGALIALGALALLTMGSFAGMFMRGPDIPVPARLVGPMVLWIAGIIVAASAAVTIAAGYGLMKVRPWARVLAIVLAFLALLHIPFGTALGIYTLVILLPGEAGQEYERMAATV